MSEDRTCRLNVRHKRLSTRNAIAVGISALLFWSCMRTRLPVMAQTAPAPGDAPKASEEAITAGLEHAYQAYLELAFAWEPSQEIVGHAVVSPVDISSRENWKGNWDRMAALLKTNGGKRYAVLVKVVDAKSRKTVWQQRVPIDPGPMAEATRLLPPDPTRIANNIDVPATLTFRIPAGTLPLGVYRVVLSFTAPDGSEHPFPGGSTIEGADYLLIRSLDTRKIGFHATVTDAPALLSHTVEIGNPGRLQFPKNDAADCQARSVWCLQAFEERVYVGYGDWDYNRGPIAVWNFAPKARQAARTAGLPARYHFAAVNGVPLEFLQEFVVQEESIDRFRVRDGMLLIPGIDGNKAHGPEGFLYGSVYLRRKGFWTKFGTVPQARHVYDVLSRNGKLFVSGTLPGGWMVSEDDGLSWQVVGEGVEELGDGEMAVVGDAVWLFGERGVSVYRNRKLEKRVLDPCPTCASSTAYRVTPFAGGVVYTTFHAWGELKETRHPLLVLRDLDEGAKVVSAFADKAVRDVCVEGSTLYVLVAGKPAGNGQFPGEIYSTEDLRTWTRLAAFTLPATPSAFARQEGAFYVGTANRGYDAATYGGSSAVHSYTYADAASGSIWQIKP